MALKLAESHLIRALDPGCLKLIILPTEKCNFRCTYCYEDFSHGRMASGIVRGIKNLLSNRLPTLHTLNVAWFGGEPLLAMPIIEDISEHIIHSCTSQHLAVTYRATITTNGWRLDLNKAARLVDLGVTQAQVSLDGLGDVHDLTRRRINGNGTFERIWNNLLRIRDSDIKLSILLRIHLSPANYWQMSEVIGKINSEFAGDQRFTVFLKSIARLGGPNDQSISTFSKGEASTARTTLLPRLDPSLLPEEGIFAGPCYAAKPNSLVIRADGTISKCTVAFNDQRNAVGSLREDGTVLIDQQKLRLWIRGLSTGDEKELACPYSVIARNPAWALNVGDHDSFRSVRD